MQRRDFLKHTISATVVISVGGIAACGGGKDSDSTSATGTATGPATGTAPGPAPGPAPGTATGTATMTSTETVAPTPTGTGGGCAGDGSGPSDTHGHSIVIPEADWLAGNPGNYNSTGGDHNHVVPMSAQDMADLAAGCTVTVQSNDSHAHTWIISTS